MYPGDDVDSLVRQSTAVTLVAGACMTTLLYHHFITLEKEITRMWTNKTSLAKLLFFLNRYVVEGMLIFNCISASRTFRPAPFCVFFLRWLVITITVSTAVVQGILVLRIWALYRRNPLAFGTALFFYLGGVATLIGLTIVDYVKEDVIIDQSLESLPGCYAKTVPEVIAGFWIAPLIVESVLFILVISRAFRWWQEGHSVNGILKILARDSSVYYAIIFALLLSSYCVFRWGPPFLSSLLVTPSTTAGCILGSHLLLNLRNRIQAVDNQVEAASTNIPLKIRRPVRSDTDYEEDSDHDGDEEITQKTDRGRGKDVELTMNPNRVLPTSTNDGISPSVPGFTASKCHDN